VVLFSIWMKYTYRVPEGLLLGIFFVLVFGMRFIWEFYKENQVDFEENMSLNMGQLLSIPLVLGGVVLIIIALKNGLKPIKN
jgi:prolipoprotein diacylglyceryltransferase